MNPPSINFSKPSLDLIQHLLTVFPSVTRSNSSHEKMVRMQGHREVIEYLATLAAPPGEVLQIQETIHRVSRQTQDAGPRGGVAAPGPAGDQGTAVRRAAFSPPQTWGGDEPGDPQS
jgi:hypothetical protein